MSCHHPIPAWRNQAGEINLGKQTADSAHLRLPCGGCLGCRRARAKEWALRCTLELQQHETATFNTLTYDQAHLPVTLDKSHLSGWLKRLRQARHRDAKRAGLKAALPIRFFASGEYGEQRGRPHYHAIIFGTSINDSETIAQTWPFGHTHTVTATPAAIAYVAGYAAKKIGWKARSQIEQVDPETGEVYYWQPPFIQMSRRPGIGHHAKQWRNSWRLYAIHDGVRQPVPRYLHQAWKEHATKEELEQLEQERYELTRLTYLTQEELLAKAKIETAKHELQAARRKYE